MSPSFALLLQRIEWSLYIAEGGPVALFNLVVLFLIAFDRKLRSQSELLFIGGLCAADLIDALAYFVSGIVRIRNVAQGTDLTDQPQLTCFYTPFVIFFFYGYQLPAVMITVVSVDRFCAVFLPSFHSRVTARTKLLVMLGSFLWVTVFFAVSAYFQHTHATAIISPHCFAADSFLSTVWAIIIGQRIVFITACVVIYIPIFVKTRTILNRTTESGKQQYRFNVTIGLTVITALLLLVIPDTVVFFNILGLAEYHTFFYVISLNKCVVNVFVYTLRQKELKKLLLQQLRRCLHLKIKPTPSSKPNTLVASTVQTQRS